MIRLTQEERQKFALWLQQEISTDEVLIKQMNKLKISEQMQQVKKGEIAAKKFVAHLLESIEEQIFQKS